MVLCLMIEGGYKWITKQILEQENMRVVFVVLFIGDTGALNMGVSHVKIAVTVMYMLVIHLYGL